MCQARTGLWQNHQLHRRSQPDRPRSLLGHRHYTSPLHREKLVTSWYLGIRCQQGKLCKRPRLPRYSCLRHSLKTREHLSECRKSQLDKPCTPALHQGCRIPACMARGLHLPPHKPHREGISNRPQVPLGYIFQRDKKILL